MRETRKTAAFYAEALVMAAVFVAVTLALTRAFALSRGLAARAGELTDAVCIAANAAEAVASADSGEELRSLLGAEAADFGGGIGARYGEGLVPDPNGPYEVRLTWDEEDGLADSIISVSRDGREIYSLRTAVYTAKGGGQG